MYIRIGPPACRLTWRPAGWFHSSGASIFFDFPLPLDLLEGKACLCDLHLIAHPPLWWLDRPSGYQFSFHRDWIYLSEGARQRQDIEFPPVQEMPSHQPGSIQAPAILQSMQSDPPTVFRSPPLRLSHRLIRSTAPDYTFRSMSEL